MPESTRRVSAVPLTAEAWAPFGWLPANDTDPADGSHRISFLWGDPHVNIIGHARSEVVSVPGGLRCDVMFRHQTHTQVLLPLDHRCVLAVAAPGTSFVGADTAGAVSAFVLEPLQSIVLHQGTWHWGPFPMDAPEVRLFNVQGFRYDEDNESVDLAGLGISVEVVTH